MKIVKPEEYRKDISQWKKISMICGKCGEQALGKMNALGLLQTQEIYYPCGHIQFNPPPENKRRVVRRKNQKETLFEL